MQLAVAEIDLSAVEHNLARIKSLAPNSKVLAMVKADGYGHNAVAMAKRLGAADALGVARIGEAIELVEAGVTTPIVLMEGCFDVGEYKLAAEHGFQITVHNQNQLNELLSLNGLAAFDVWLKLDSGMHRLGFDRAQFETAYEQLNRSDNCSNLVLMTHFACADDVPNEFNETQLSLFNDITAGCSEAKSIANSATILTKPDRHLDWVRPGIILYGSSPVIGTTFVDYDLKPVMRFKTKVIGTKTIEAGETVGYGGDWRSQRETNLAIVGIGYGDGYPRHAQSGTPVLINGKECPLVGRVSMDMITVDVTDIAEVNIGDEVILWGPELAPERVAQHARTISYTLFCGITNRVKRVYK